jgi:prepilin-type N-terminal cleavage/methylation domain-containing protein
MRMKQNKSSGFTLIELLVVIAVIGILAAVVMASLNTSRAKGNDASIKSDLVTVRSQAELYNNSNSTFGTFTSGACPSVSNTGSGSVFYDATVKQAIEQAGVLGGGTKGTTTTGTTSNTSCVANGGTWAAAVVLSSSNTTAWCVDSGGKSKIETITANTPSGAYALTGSVYSCN